MPMLEHPAGAQPQIILAIGYFRRRFERSENDIGLTVLVTIKLEPRARLYVRIKAFLESPARFLAINHGPPQATHPMVMFIRCEIVRMPASESCIFLEQAFLHIKTMVMGLIIQLSCLFDRKTVNLAVAKQYVVECFTGILRH